MLAFLFTDIEGSTRLWELHPDRMAQALERHDFILRTAVESRGGTLVKTTGDGVMAVFPDAREALASSVDAQLGLGAEPWPDEPLRVRMGVHAGEAVAREGDFFGPAVNRTARIMTAAHGGQILASGAAVAMGAPDEIGLRDLGIHRLRDLTDPEHLFQVTHPDLIASFPPPTTLDTHPNNLPFQTTEFFGRGRELDAIQGMLGDPSVRLITLTGPGGSGKTRLAVQVAAEVLDLFSDGVFFVDVSQDRQPEAVYESILRTVAGPGGDGDALQTAKTRLRDRELLLVLDNFEQVTEAAGGVVELLQTAPGLKVLVTSRESLRVGAERTYPIPPLELPSTDDHLADVSSTEAVQLFLDRARAVAPQFELDEANFRVVVEICARLDGLPLAIELAAARLNFFSAEELLERLSSRTGDVVTGTRRDLPERQRTLVDTIDWSYDLLDSAERKMFDAMSAFTGADLRAIEKLASVVAFDRPLDALSSLVDKSLVKSSDSQGRRRFSMLRTIREYAQDRLAADREFEQTVLRAHAELYTDRSQELRAALLAGDRPSALADLEAEAGNLRTAWKYWVEREDLESLYLLLDGLWALLDAKGWYHTAIELAEDLLSLLSTADPSPERTAEEVTLRTSLARALMAVYGWGPEVEEMFQRIAAMHEEAKASPSQRFPVMRAMATFYLNLRRFDTSAEIGREILEMARVEKNSWMEVDGLMVLGVTTAFTGDVPEGLRLLDRAIEVFSPTRHAPGRFWLGPSPGVVAGTAAGLIRWQGGELKKARSQLSTALSLARELGHPFSLAYAVYHFGYFSLLSHAPARSKECAIELRRIAREHQYQVWGALADVLEGVALTMLGDTDDGHHLTEKGVVLYQGLSTPPIFWPLILGLRAQATAAAGDLETALQLVEEAIEVSGGLEFDPTLGLIRAKTLAALGRSDDAVKALTDVAAVAREGDMKLIRLLALTEMVGREAGDAYRTELTEVYVSMQDQGPEIDLEAARAVLSSES
jgi:predicted ATPase/class 3 adenylate cyclase